jgi:hypothetical protein
MSDTSKKAGLKILIAVLPIVLVGGCSEYLSREDKIYLGAGDSVAANKVVHVVDPWPRDGFNTNGRTTGQRLVAPVQRYRDGLQRAPAAPAAGATASAANATQTTSN